TEKQVSLSEATLVTLALYQAIWTAVWSIEYPLLTLSFSGLFALHFGSMFLRRMAFRAGFCLLHAFVWTMLLILTLLSEPRGPIVPVAVALVILAGFLHVKLSRADGK